MPTRNELIEIRDRTRAYLVDTLLPFWIQSAPDSEFGGFLTYFDRDGHPTGETTKTFLMQIRTLYSMASAHRAGYGNGEGARLAKAGADFILEHYWDNEEEGWFWIADREGRPIVRDKVGYGQCFALYTFSEYFLATGEERGREAADRTYAAILKHMTDSQNGGYIELMGPDWQPKSGGKTGGDRKSLDVHMHLMEALTTYYEMTHHPTHRRHLLEVVDLILTRMLHPENGLGYIHFTHDFVPLPRIVVARRVGPGCHSGIGRGSPGPNISGAQCRIRVVVATCSRHSGDRPGRICLRRKYDLRSLRRVGYRRGVRRRLRRHTDGPAHDRNREAVLAARRSAHRHARRL